VRQVPLPAPGLGPGRPNLVLAGFSATGKTAVAQLAADLLEMPWVDLDEAAEQRSGLSLPQLFRTLGESGFRELEAELLGEAARLSGAVIATGGGAVMSSQFAPLASGAVPMVLTASVAEIEFRLGDTSARPMLADGGPARIRELLAEREHAYASAGPTVETSGKSLVEVADLVAERYRAAAGQRPVEVTVPGPGGAYPVAVGRGSLERLEELLRTQLPGAGRVVVVADSAVAGDVGARVTKLLRDAGREIHQMAVPRGESAKQLAVISGLWDQFLALGIDRGDVIVAVGGGATLDAVGFAAATWSRGVPWVAVPTTVLAMVDASIGGKVAIDRVGAKNAVGAFHHPRAVTCDETVLGSLLPAVARDGLAEVVKSAVLASPLLLDWLGDSRPAGAVPTPHLSWLIEQAVRIKAAYVGADPEDQGLRQSLNLGHTYAHGLEAASDFRVPHGRAVAFGLVAAAEFGAALAISESGLPASVRRALDRQQLLQPLPELERDRIRSALRLDKKRRAGQAAFVVPVKGGASLVTEIQLEQALEPLWRLLEEVQDQVEAKTTTPVGAGEPSA